MDGILSGTRVLDFSRYKAGPYCAQLLGDMGAEVIRVDRPSGGEDRDLGPYTAEGKGLYTLFTCRNKVGITLNLRVPAARELVRRLVAVSDVLVENFTPGSEESRTLDYGVLSQLNPRLIHASITGFGHTGPYAQRPSFDTVVQGMSGAMSITGFPGAPPLKAGVNYVDFSAGVYAALGVMYALYHREKTGLGQHVDIGLLDVALSFMESTFAEFKCLGSLRPQLGNRNYFTAPFDTFRTKDGYVFIAVVGQGIWQRFIEAIRIEELAGDPRFKNDRSRSAHADELGKLVSTWAAQLTTAEVVEAMEQAQVPCGPVYAIPETCADPQVWARQMVVDADHEHFGIVPLIGNPVKMSRTPMSVRRTAPAVGEHNWHVYGELLRLKPEEIAQLRDEGTI